MPVKAQNIEPSAETHEWAERCGYWLRALEAGTPKRKRRERESSPLVLVGHGLSMQVDGGSLLIRDGHTHFPAERREYRFFKGGLDLPPRIVIVDGSGNISLDALDWLAEQNIDLIRLGYDGRIITLTGNNGYSADRQKVTWQIATRANEQKRLEFTLPLIEGKIKETLYNLEHLMKPSASTDKAIETAQAALGVLSTNPPDAVAKLYDYEGRVAQGYFYAWRDLDIKWKAGKRYPIQSEWKRYFSRSSLNTRTRIRNMYATHPINAMLNYAYGVLESTVRIQAIADGYDPSIGIAHGDAIKPQRHAFVFDLMEPIRPVTDRTIIKLIKEHTFSGADFMLQPNGVCRVNPELCRSLVNATK